MEVLVSRAWQEGFAEAHAGVLVMRNVRNDGSSETLEAEVRRLEQAVRSRHAGLTRAELATLPTVQAYQRHYRAFGQTYHLLGQLESVALKGRPLASPGGPLVTAMFAAEIDHLLLTAGHDLDALVWPLVLDCSRAGESFTAIGGREIELRAGDMVMRDGAGIISAVLSGPDQRTRLHAGSAGVVYVTYAPAGVSAAEVREHMEQIAALVVLAAPAAKVGLLETYPTD